MPPRTGYDTMTEVQRKKLPTWAQNAIRDLELEIAALKERVEGLTGESAAEPGPFSYTTVTQHMRDAIRLPKYAHIKAQLEEVPSEAEASTSFAKNRHSVDIDTALDKPHQLRVSTSYGVLHVVPHGGNCVLLEVREYD